MKKVCKHCNKEKDLQEFYILYPKTSNPAIDNFCKKCKNYINKINNTCRSQRKLRAQIKLPEFKGILICSCGLLFRKTIPVTFAKFPAYKNKNNKCSICTKIEDKELREKLIRDVLKKLDKDKPPSQQ